MMTGLDRGGIFEDATTRPFARLARGEPAISVAGLWWASDEPIGTPPPALVELARRALIGGAELFGRHGGQHWLAPAVAKPGPALALVRGTPREAAPPRLHDALVEQVERAIARTPLGDVCAPSPSLLPLCRLLDRIAATALPVLLLGETGTGKEVVARALHEASRRGGEFVAENCSALPEALVESELFGVRRGAYTGAAADRRGRVRQSHRGTLFLDEIGDLSLSSQAKLLRVLQEREVRPLGAERSERVDIRVIAATHRDLRVRTEAGLFREDLYFRLAGFEARLPPLRERRSDLPFLAARLLARLRVEGFGVKGVDEQAMERLAAEAWRGNVRDLENRLRRAAALARGEKIGERDVATGTGWDETPARNLEERAILDALELSGGVKSDAARRLGWSRQKLYRRLARLGIAPGS